MLPSIGLLGVDIKLKRIVLTCFIRCVYTLGRTGMKQFGKVDIASLKESHEK